MLSEVISKMSACFSKVPQSLYGMQYFRLEVLNNRELSPRPYDGCSVNVERQELHCWQTHL